jgi:sigma-B regulation protein RsbU (phosphoserine phosphatase)
MNVQDLAQNPRIASLTELTRELAKCQTPQQTLQALQSGFQKTYGFLATMLISTRRLPRGQYRVIGTQLEPGSLYDVPDQTPDMPGTLHCGGVVAAIIARCEPQLIQEVEWNSDPYFHETLRGYASVMAIPLAGDHLPMTWAILMKRSPDRFTVSDLEESVQRLAISSALLENQMLAVQLARANERIDQDARKVGELQRALLPATLPQNAGFEVVVSYEPSGRAGGDLYDFFPLDDRGNDSKNGNATSSPWFVFVGDAAGHDLAAAVVMAIVQSVLHSHPIDIAGPATLLAHVNRQLCRKGIGGFVTAFLGVYEPLSRRFTYVNAGHPPPLLKRLADGTIHPLEAALSYPLGIEESEEFTEAAVQFDPGDIVLLYTDGITEARDASGNLFEGERLMHAFRDSGEEPVELIEHLRESVRAYQQGRAAGDDQTLVAVRVV